jgi:hypothetical protein
MAGLTAAHIAFIREKVTAISGVPCKALNDANLLYRSSRDGIAGATFHAKVGGRGRTVVIASVVGANGVTCILGASRPWASQSPATMAPS